jgi:glycosidase
VGEIWDGNPRWANDTHFDGLMHYPLREALLAALTGRENSLVFADKVEGFFGKYEHDFVQAMYVPLGSHDTERIATVLGSLDKVRLAFLFQFSYPGAPAIYYGDEVGLEGKADPDSRRAFPWDPSDWKADLRPFVQTLVSLRKARPSLRRGEFVRLITDADTGLYAFARRLGGERTVLVMNLSDHALEASVPLSKLSTPHLPFRNLMDGRSVPAREGSLKVKLGSWSGVCLGT